MDKRTAGIIATVATVLLCGCPGLLGICWGAIAIPVSFVPGAQIDIAGNNDPQAALTAGIVGLCLGLIFIAIPIAVGYFTLRNRPAASTVISAPSYGPTTPPPPPPSKPDEPSWKPDEPPSKSDEPSSKSDEPSSKSDEPSSKSDEPSSKSDEPSSDPDEPIPPAI